VREPVTTAMPCELVGGPHDGLTFTLAGMLRSIPNGADRGAALLIPGTVMILLGDDRPRPIWDDSVHVCTGTHPPLSVYAAPRTGDTRYRYVGPFPCVAVG